MRRCVWTLLVCLSFWPVSLSAQSADYDPNLFACRNGGAFCDHSKPRPDDYPYRVLPVGMRTFEHTSVRSFLSLPVDQPVIKTFVTGSR